MRKHSHLFPVVTLWLWTGSAAFGFDTTTHEAMSRLALARHPGSAVDPFLKNQLGLPRGVNEVGLFQLQPGLPAARPGVGVHRRHLDALDHHQ